MKWSFDALSGARVVVDLPDRITPDRTATSVAYFSIEGVECEFTSGPRDLGLAVANELNITLEESYRMAQGSLLIGSKEESWSAPDDGYTFTNKHLLAVWLGSSHSVHCHLFDTSSADALGVFKRFSIVEMSNGVRMTPSAIGVLPGRRKASLMLNLPVLGLFIVRRRAVQDLPRWRGSSVAGGEAYCDKKDAARPTYLLASDTATATVVPDHSAMAGVSGTHNPHQPTIDLLSAVKVGWAE